MTKLAILSLAATALVPAGLMAQTVAPPEPWQDVPSVELDLPGTPPVQAAPVQPAPPPGVTWQRPPAAPATVAPAAAPVPPRSAPIPAPQARVATSAAVVPPTPAPAPPPPRVAPVPVPPSIVAVHTPPPPPAARGGRVEPGFVMPPFWTAPQFEVREWDAYAFAEPGPDERWFRYYDEAVLVDRHGRVLDVRHDVDWDERRDAWAYDPRGIPLRAEDPAYDWDGYGAYGPAGYYDDGYGPCEAAYVAGYPPPPPCFYGGYPPYGYGSGGVTITETTITTQTAAPGGR